MRMDDLDETSAFFRKKLSARPIKYPVRVCEIRGVDPHIVSISDADGEQLAETGYGETGLANAVRFSLCVNACKNLTNEELDDLISMDGITLGPFEAFHEKACKSCKAITVTDSRVCGTCGNYTTCNIKGFECKGKYWQPLPEAPK